MCVCDSETEENWCFFFDNLKSIIEPQGRKITFISDRGAGLLSAFKKVLPEYTQMFCYKHLSENLVGKFTGSCAALKNSVRSKFGQLAYSSSDKQYRFHLRELREIGGASIIDEFFKDLPVENWCRAFFVKPRYGLMANIMAESFNSWFVDEHELPAYAVLEQTQLKVMKKMAIERNETQLWMTILIYKMETELKKNMDGAVQYTYVYSLPNIYEFGESNLMLLTLFVLL